MLKPITIDRYTSPWEAHIARGLLESEGIPASLADEHQIWTNWQMSQVFGGVKLQVAASHRKRALEVLTARQNGQYESALNATLQLLPNACPKCASTDIRTLRSRSSTLTVIALFLLIGIFYPPEIGDHCCNACKVKFKRLL